MQSDQYEENPGDNGWLVNDAFITAELGGDHIFRLPHLEQKEFRIIRYLGALVTRSGGQVIFKVDNQNDTIVIGSDLISATHYKTLICGPENGLSYGIGYFEIIGRGGLWSGGTIWHIIPIYIHNA